MIPIQLTFEGLYSYQEKQTIDFENLTNAGLFGIFGSVGSGKSSILEAISFALYGSTERLNLAGRAYNMMNLKSNRLYLEFDFYNYENKKFKVTREYKRNSRRFDDVTNAGAVFYEETNGNWIPLEHTNPEAILGLSYQNFKRTIIIPQGQFKEFLELGPTDRTKMMKEIFNLEKFDLQYKTAALRKKNDSALDQLEGKLSGFEEVSIEKIEELAEQHKTKEEARVKVDQKHIKINDSFLKLKALREEADLLKSNEKRLSEMNEQQEKYQNLEKEIEQFEHFHKSFHQLILNQIEFDKENSALEESEKKTQSDYKELKEKIDLHNKTKEELQPKFDSLESNKQKAEDLQTIIHLKETDKKITELQPKFEKGEGVIKENIEKSELFKKKIKQLVEDEETLKKKRINPQLLIDVSAWYQQMATFNLNLENQKKTIKDIEAKVNEQVEKFKKLEINAKTFIQDFEKELKSLNETKEKINAHKNHLVIEQKLSEYSDALHDGEACPLCGSLEHPNVISAEDVSDEIQKAENEIQSIEEKIEKLNAKKSQFESISNTKKIYEDQLIQEKHRLETIEKQIQEFKKTFVWKEFDADNSEQFELKKQASQTIEKQWEEKLKELNEAKEAENKHKEFSQKCIDRLNVLKSTETALKAQFETNQIHLKHLKFEEFRSKEIDEIQLDLNALLHSNQKVEKDYKETEEALTQLNLKKATVEANLNSIKTQTQVLSKKIELLNTSLNEQLAVNQLNSIDEVKAVLSKDLDVNALRKQLEDFRVEYKSLQGKIKEQQEKLKEIDVSDEEFEKRQIEFDASVKELKLATEEVVQLKTNLDRLKKSYKEKEDLIKEKHQLEKRKENLNTLANLFKGQGFVEYVSSIYLRQLCDNANVRFHRMTRNQLSLQLNDKYDFEVIDYLNEGRSRSVKTLSGGQSFQVSLSLALALAESVQSHHLSDKNFFFIDEGFGTQDSESVNIVFETLMQLQKENRIVGIISHVNELQERIPVSLKVNKDEERGSLIQASWE